MSGDYVLPVVHGARLRQMETDQEMGPRSQSILPEQMSEVKDG